MRFRSPFLILLWVVSSLGRPPAAPAPSPSETTPDVALPGALAPSAVASGDRLTLAQAQAEAHRRNPALQAATQGTLSAEQNLQATRLPLDPQVSLDTGYSGVTNHFKLFNPEDAAVSALWEVSGRHRFRVRGARAALAQSTFDQRTAALTLDQAVGMAYVNLQVANRTLGAQSDLYRLVARQTDLTERQFRLGAAKESDVIRLQIALTQAEQALLQAQTGVSVARSNLNLELGRPADQPIDAAEPLAYSPIAVDAGQLKRDALAHRPEVRSEEAALQSLRAAISLERSQYYPDVSFSVHPYGILNSSKQYLLGTAGVVFPLPLGSIRHQVRKADYDLAAEEARAQQVRNQVTLDVETALLALAAAQKTVESYQSGIVDRSRSLVDRTQKGFEIGGATLLDVIDAQSTYRTSLVNYYQAIGNYEQAVYQLERAVGEPVSAARAPRAPGGAQ